MAAVLCYAGVSENFVLNIACNGLLENNRFKYWKSIYTKIDSCVFPIHLPQRGDFNSRQTTRVFVAEWKCALSTRTLNFVLSAISVCQCYKWSLAIIDTDKCMRKVFLFHIIRLVCACLVCFDVCIGRVLTWEVWRRRGWSQRWNMISIPLSSPSVCQMPDITHQRHIILLNTLHVFCRNKTLQKTGFWDDCHLKKKLIMDYLKSQGCSYSLSDSSLAITFATFLWQNVRVCHPNLANLFGALLRVCKNILFVSAPQNVDFAH